MYGDNPIRPPVSGDGSTLEVKHIFPTLQGEGPFTGYPSVFVRLGGCNLACDFCDTDFENYGSMTLDALLNKVETLAMDEDGVRIRHLVVITGGEPLRQPIERFCAVLLDHGFQVQIETNGTLYRSLPEGVHVICSPKNTGKGYFPIRPDLLGRVNAFKFIISVHDPLYGEVGDVGQSTHHTPVYVQPMDESDAAKNTANLAKATQLAMRHGYRLSVQMHKLAGIE